MILGQHAAFVFILSDCLHALLLVAVRAREDGWDAEAALGYTHTHTHTAEGEDRKLLRFTLDPP